MADTERETAIVVTTKNRSKQGTDEVTAQLRAMRVEAEKVAVANGQMTLSLDKVNGLAKQFATNSRALTQSAEEYAAATAKAGGVAKLTEADQARVNRVVGDAIAQYRRLGQEAPAHLLALQRETAKSRSLMESIPSSVSGVAGALGIAFSAQAVIGFTTSIFDSASAIHDQAVQLGFSAEAFQRNAYAVKQSGGSQEDFTKAATKLSDNLANGDKSTVAALAKAGLEFQKIRAMKPEDAWLAVTDAVGKIEDPMQRVQVAQDLMGKSAAKLLPGMIEGYGKLGEAATVMSDETVDRLEAAQDAWDDLKNKATIVSGEIIAELMKAFSVGTDQKPGTLKLVWWDLTGQLEQRAQQAGMSRRAAGWGEDMRLAAPQAPPGDYTRQLAETRAQVDALTASQRQNIDAALKMSVSTSDIAKQLNIAEAVVELYKDKVTASAEAAKKAAAEEKARTLALANVTSSMADLTQAQVNQIAALLRQGKGESDIAKAYGFTAQQVKDVAAWTKFLDDQRKNSASNLTALIKGQRDYANEVAASLNAQATISKLQKQAADAEAQNAMSVYDFKRKQLIDWFDAQVAAFKGDERATAEHYDAVLRITTAGLNALAAAESVASMKSAVEAQKARAGWLQILDGIPGLMQQALTGGGGMTGFVKALRSQVESEIGSQVIDSDVVSKGLGKTADGIGKFFGNSVGNAFAMAVPGLGPIVGALLGKGFSALGGALGLGHAGRDMVKDFADQMGGFDELHKKLGQLGADGERMWVSLTQGVGRNNKDQAKAAIDEVTKALERQQQVLSQYGLSLDDLKSPQEKIDDLLKDYQDLKKLGFGDDKLVPKMSGQLNEMIRAALDGGAKIPAAFRPLIEQLIRSGGLADDVRDKLLGITEAKAPWQEMQSIAEEFGISLDALGPRFQQAKLIDGAEDLAHKWDVLITNGADVGAVMEGMSERANEFLHNALKWGLEVPASMRPMLEQMAKAGLLTDENGDKLEDLSRVKFGQTLADEFQPFLDKIDDLIDAIRGGISGAIDDAKDHAARNPIVVGVEIDPRGNAAVNPGQNRGSDLPPGWYYDENGALHGPNTQFFANGGLAEERQLAVLAERGQREIVGSEAFMADALSAALQRIGIPNRSVAPGDSSDAPVTEVVNLTVMMDGAVVHQSQRRYLRKNPAARRDFAVDLTR